MARGIVQWFSSRLPSRLSAAVKLSVEEKRMSIASVPSSIESTSTGRENGTTAPSSQLTLAIPDDVLYEVVDGKIVEKTVGATEVEIANILNEYLRMFARTHRLGRALMEMIFRIDVTKDLQRRPDVAFVSHARWPYNRRVPNVAVWDMVPDLAVEVVSPSNTAFEVQRKIHEYFDAGVSQVWIVYPPQREVYVFASTNRIEVLQRGQDLDGGNLLPGFRLSVAALFEDEANTETETK
jgi:Uma2 family endonuclease